MSEGRRPPRLVFDEWCDDYHCAGDCGLRGHGWQHAQPRDTSSHRNRRTLVSRHTPDPCRVHNASIRDCQPGIAKAIGK